jgi:hypothetical protein
MVLLRFYNNVATIVLPIFYFVQNIGSPNFTVTFNYFLSQRTSNPNMHTVIFLFKYLKYNFSFEKALEMLRFRYRSH